MVGGVRGVYDMNLPHTCSNLARNVDRTSLERIRNLHAHNQFLLRFDLPINGS
jgi:hypothetical protein